MLRYRHWLAQSLFLLFASTAYGQEDVCQSVLSLKAFDIHDAVTQEHVSEAAKRDICDEKWNTRDVFQNRVRKWDSNFDMVDFFKGTGNADLTGTDHTIEKDFHILCESTDNNFLRDFLTADHTQVAHFAVSAWENCIKTTQQVGLWSRLDLASDRSAFSIEVRFKPAGVSNKLHILGYTHDAGFSCKFLDKDAVDIFPEKEGAGNEFSLICKPSSTSEVQVSLITSENDKIGPFTIPPKMPFDPEAAVKELQGELDALEMRSIAVEETVNALKLDDADLKSLAASIPKPSDYYIVHGPLTEPSTAKTVEIKCNDGDILISAVCTNDVHAQAAVGPYIKGDPGNAVVSCATFFEGKVAEGAAICLRVRH